MASRSISHVLGVSSSLSGKAWSWRGGNMELGSSGDGLENDILTQLLMTRGVDRSDIKRNLKPTLRDFLPDHRSFRLPSRS